MGQPPEKGRISQVQDRGIHRPVYAFLFSTAIRPILTILSKGDLSMNNPSNLKYSRSDEWIKLEGNVATLGITDYAQEQLSDVVYVEIRGEVGESVKKGTVCVVIESVKAAADVNYPVSGKVVEVNSSLADATELVNSDPYGKAWMLKVEITDASEMDDLMDSSAYEAYCQEREH
jgi:glycine cleavage system H protein